MLQFPNMWFYYLELPFLEYLHTYSVVARGGIILVYPRRYSDHEFNVLPFPTQRMRAKIAFRPLQHYLVVKCASKCQHLATNFALTQH